MQPGKLAFNSSSVIRRGIRPTNILGVPASLKPIKLTYHTLCWQNTLNAFARSLLAAKGSEGA